ncbi:ferritin-like domain-containing protein [Mucilaginibacter sp.]|jgi:rubrerythrin|uniref:ferritin-like domain-containing protein n=1 Tax=Mucilaginibacter sp. TaxID=1882438 RepID=UPI0025DED2B6|nr:ferritin-like domain-containing protein [Mucilaginibacter sp.]
MNLFNIIEEIEKIDPEFNDRLNPRRAAIKNITSFGSKVALAAMPFALGTMIKRAYADTMAPSVVEVLNYALTLEYLESSFYNAGVAASGLIPASDTAYIADIQDDENKHVTFLSSAITASGGTPVAKPTFDFTAGGGTGNGPFKGVFTAGNYTSIFLKVALAFEDTGVRAYKGQAPNLLGNKDILTAALSIHAVEARHASAIRSLLGVTPWITSTASKGNDTGVSLVDGNYDGEQNVSQGGVDVTTLKNASGGSTSVAVATAAFDEPLSMTQVLALLSGTFIVK